MKAALMAAMQQGNTRRVPLLTGWRSRAGSRRRTRHSLISDVQSVGRDEAGPTEESEPQTAPGWTTGSAHLLNNERLSNRARVTEAMIVVTRFSN